MTAHELLSDLYRQGFNLKPLPGGLLEVRPASRLTPELWAALKQRKAEILALLKAQQQPVPSPDYRGLYQQDVAAIVNDCWALDPAWLLDHPEFYQRIRALDGRLTEMEQRAASESEYRAALRQLVKVVQDARAAYEQTIRQDSARVVQ